MNFNIRKSFALKLSLSIITAVVIIFMTVLIYNYQVSKQLLLDGTRENIKNLEQSTLNEIDNVLLPAQQVVESLSSFLSSITLTESEINAIIKANVLLNEEINGCTVAFAPYKFAKDKYYFDPYYYREERDVKRFDLDNDAEYDYFKWPWYTLPRDEGKGIWSEPYFDEGGGNILMVTYSQPFYRNIDGKKEFYGVVACDISIEWLQEFISQMKIFKTGYAFILSSKGKFIAHRNREYFEKGLTFQELAQRYNSPIEKTIGENMIAGKHGHIRYFSQTTHKISYISYQPLETTGWSIGIVVPEEELYSKLDSITLKLFIIGIIGYILTLFVILIFSARATIPLKKLAKATFKIGSGDFNAKVPNVRSLDEIGILSTSFIKMQENLIKYVTNLKETTAAKEKIERDLIIGKEIQQSLLPHNFPHSKEFDIFAKLLPAKEVAGDLYDFFFIDDERLCFAVGDVSGKGVSAALFMAVTKTLLRAKVGVNTSIAYVLNTMNKELSRENESAMFVTFFICILNIRTGDLEYSNAGHNPPLIKEEDKFRYLDSDNPSPPLGVFENSEYGSTKLKLKKNDIIYLYTDGITEAMSKDDVQFTEEKLLEIIEENKNETVEKIVGSILSSVASHALTAEQSDDITILVLKYNG